MQISIEQVESIVDRIQLPRQLMDRRRILPYAWEQDVLLLATDTEWRPMDIDRVQLELGYRIRVNRVPESAEFDRILFAIVNSVSLEELTGDMAISCDSRFKQKCPLNWFELAKTQDELARFCRVCDQTVHFARTQDERQTHAREGHCVAFREISAGSEGEIDMGYVVPEDDDPPAITASQYAQAAARLQQVLCDALEASMLELRLLDVGPVGMLAPVADDGTPVISAPKGDFIRKFVLFNASSRHVFQKLLADVFGPPSPDGLPSEPAPVMRGEQCIGEARADPSRTRIQLSRLDA